MRTRRPPDAPRRWRATSPRQHGYPKAAAEQDRIIWEKLTEPRRLFERDRQNHRLAAADIASAPAARRQIADGNPNPPKPPRLRRDQHHSQHPRSSDVRHNRPPARPQPKATPPAWDTASAETTHGIAGPLALLALTLRDGITVNGHTAAITRICGWLDTWQRHANGRTWWPQTLTRTELHHGTPAQQSPMRPSWCYGTPGVFPIN